MAYTTLDNISTQQRIECASNGSVRLSVEHDRGMIDALIISVVAGDHETIALLYPSEAAHAFAEAISLVNSFMPKTELQRFVRLAQSNKPIPPDLAMVVAQTISVMQAELAISLKNTIMPTEDDPS